MRWLLRLADLLRVLLAFSAIVAVAASDARGAGILAAATVAGLIVRFALLPATYDLAFVVALVVQGGGEALGLYDAFGWFDTVVHVTIPALTAPVAYLALARLEVVRDLRAAQEGLAAHGDAGVFVVTVALGLAVGGLWELCEGVSDGLLGSRLQESVGDTNRDLLADFAGAVLGAVGLVAWNRLGQGTVKRGHRGRPDLHEA